MDEEAARRREERWKRERKWIRKPHDGEKGGELRHEGRVEGSGNRRRKEG